MLAFSQRTNLKASHTQKNNKWNARRWCPCRVCLRVSQCISFGFGCCCCCCCCCHIVLRAPTYFFHLPVHHRHLLASLQRCRVNIPKRTGLHRAATALPHFSCTFCIFLLSVRVSITWQLAINIRSLVPERMRRQTLDFLILICFFVATIFHADDLYASSKIEINDNTSNFDLKNNIVSSRGMNTCRRHTHTWFKF